MKLEAGKEMDKKCVLDWLNKVYITPSLSYSEYTDEEIRILAHDALVLLKEGAERNMIVHQEGMETKVLILPYEESTIDKGAYLQTCREPIEIISVKDHENCLVEIIFPHGEKVIANAGQLITAIQKCVM